MRIRNPSAFACLAAGAVCCLLPLSRAQAAEVITATAHVKTAGGVEASAPVRIVVDRTSTDEERDAVMAALKRNGTTAVRDLLLTWKPIGSVQVGATNTAIKYAYARAMGEARLVTVVTGSPIVFIGSSLPGAAPRAGFELGLLLLTVAPTAAGDGEMVPAAKVRLDDRGAIVTDDYGVEVVRLSNVVGR